MKITKAYFKRHVLIPGVGEVPDVTATDELPIIVSGAWVKIGGYLYHGDLFARLEVDESAAVSSRKAGGAAAGEGPTKSAGPLT